MKRRRQNEKGNIEWQRRLCSALVTDRSLPEQATAEAGVKKPPLLGWSAVVVQFEI
jgi:hypothetical protein